MMISLFLIVITLVYLGNKMDDLVIDKIVGYLPSVVYQITYENSKYWQFWNDDRYKGVRFFTSINKLNTYLHAVITSNNLDVSNRSNHIYNGEQNSTFVWNTNHDVTICIKKIQLDKIDDIPIFD